MPTIDPNLIQDARAQLGVTHLSDLRAGGQKVVELADRGGESLVLKVVSIGTSRPDAFRRAEREVHLLASLNSEYVVKVASDLVTVGTPPEAAAWLEEHLDGDDLSASLFVGPWSWDETALMALHVAKGLDAAHEIKVVHRDLSANNVRRLSNGSYKVMDFGFARYTLMSGLTLVGQPGTPGYASPEHLRSYSGVPTAASDVFAVGNLMFAALTGELPIPYKGDDADYRQRLTKVEIPDLGALRADLDPNQRALVMRCLHRQPARRYLNGGALAKALEALI